MSLIERLRASTENTSTRLLLFLAIALFIGVGGKRARGLAGGVAATVDGDAISTPEFREALRAESQRAGAGLTEAERDELANATLENLISQTVILHEADRIGVAVGDVELKRAITQMKMFQVDGKFSEKAYRDGLDKMDKTEAAFTIELRRMLILQKMIDLAGRGVFVTDDEARAVWLEESTTQELA